MKIMLALASNVCGVCIRLNLRVAVLVEIFHGEWMLLVGVYIWTWKIFER